MTFEEVFKNKELIIAQKKNAIKHCDVIFSAIDFTNNHKNNAEKLDSSTVEEPNQDVLQAKLIINTTNVIDSHRDCHIPNLWAKSLQETKILYLLQEHEMEFDKVIADSVKDELKAYTENIPWKKLNYSYEGKTQALIFDTQIKKEVNPFMFEMYKKGRVYNHSVGMRYVKIYLCADRNEAEYAQEKENWNKYYPLVANKDVADEKGYFWAVTEAKVIEGSAVIKGSNEYTPVMEIEFEKEAVNNTSNQNTPEPSNDTQKEKKQFFTNLLN
jgi:hypothetical protein